MREAEDIEGKGRGKKRVYSRKGEGGELGRKDEGVKMRWKRRDGNKKLEEKWEINGGQTESERRQRRIKTRWRGTIDREKKWEKR